MRCRLINDVIHYFRLFCDKGLTALNLSHTQDILHRLHKPDCLLLYLSRQFLSHTGIHFFRLNQKSGIPQNAGKWCSEIV